MAVKSLAQSSIRQAPPVNSLLAGYSFQDFHHLETVRLGGAAASVTFNNLLQYSGEFRHLQVRLVARGGRNLQNEPLYMSFNGVAGTSYSTHALAAGASSFFIEGYPNLSSMERVGNIAGATADANVFGANVIDILDPFSSTKNKTVRTLGGVAPSSGGVIGLFSGAFLNTSPINTMTITNFSATSFVTGSRFSLYGIR